MGKEQLRESAAPDPNINMTRKALFLLPILLFSCKLFKKSEQVEEPAKSTTELFYVSVHSYENISLRSDSTFFYMLNLRNNKARTEGYWKQISEDTIVLFSKEDPQNLPFTLDSTLRPDSRTVFIARKNDLGALQPHLKKYELIINDTGSADLMANDSVFRSDAVYTIQLHAVFHQSSNLYNRELRSTVRKLGRSASTQFVLHSPFNEHSASIKPIQDTVTYSLNSLYWNGRIFKRFKR